MIELYNRLVLIQSQNEPISVFSLDEVREVRDYNPDLIRRSIAGSESTALGTHLSAIHPVWGVMKGESCAFAFLHDPELKGLGGWAVTSDGSVLRPGGLLGRTGLCVPAGSEGLPGISAYSDEICQ